MANSTRQLGRCPGTASRAFVLFVLAAVVLSLTPIAADAYVQTPIFRSQNAASEVADPQNPTNDVIRFVTGTDIPSGIASVTRDLRAKNLTVADMTNMISVDFFFLDRTCVGGSPRFQLNIQLGTGAVHNAFGYFGNQAFGGGCPTGEWIHQDLANLVSTAAVWDLSQFGGPFATTWAGVLTFFTGVPHEVRACGVFDDSGSFQAGAVGTVYLDNVQCHDRNLEDHLDVAPGTNVPF